MGEPAPSPPWLEGWGWERLVVEENGLFNLEVCFCVTWYKVEVAECWYIVLLAYSVFNVTRSVVFNIFKAVECLLFVFFFSLSRHHSGKINEKVTLGMLLTQIMLKRIEYHILP